MIALSNTKNIFLNKQAIFSDDYNNDYMVELGSVGSNPTQDNFLYPQIIVLRPGVTLFS